jgi:hypothetical protein
MGTSELCLGDVVAPRRRVSLHFLGDEGVLFDAAGQKLYALNTTATFIWCCLEDRLRLPEVAGKLTGVFGIRPAEARSYVDEIIGRWREFQLVGAPGSLEERPPAPPGRANGAHRGERFELKRQPAAERRYRLLDSAFRLRFSGEALLQRTAPLLAPLASRAPQQDAALLDLVSSHGRFVLYADGREVDRCSRAEQVVPMVKASLVYLALERSQDFCAIHAAGLARGGDVLLLPGAAGSGKSTLAAALISAGFRLLGDDTIVLAQSDLAARPVPFAICLKSGSWPLLAGRYPGLEKEPVHDRLDGKRVRYLMPPAASLCGDAAARLPVRVIAFPRREPGAAAALVPLARGEALSRLLKGFYPLADGLNGEKVDRLLQWIAGIDCFELRHSTLDDGVARLKEVLP